MINCRQILRAQTQLYKTNQMSTRHEILFEQSLLRNRDAIYIGRRQGGMPENGCRSFRQRRQVFPFEVQGESAFQVLIRFTAHSLHMSQKICPEAIENHRAMAMLVFGTRNSRHPVISPYINALYLWKLRVTDRIAVLAHKLPLFFLYRIFLFDFAVRTSPAF